MGKASKPPDDHVARLNRYARDVVGGAIQAGKFTVLACKRHLDDLKRSKDKFYPYKFDHVAANRICCFAELLPHVKGQWAKRHELIRLEPWECFVLGVPFGWKHKKNGRRRFREIYDEISRKNGKSIIGAIIGNYMFLADGEFGAEVYCLSPETPVLCGDLRWRPIGELDRGDQLIAFDEQVPKSPEIYRKFRTAEVTATSLIQRPCKRIRFVDGGEVVASDEHLWLCKRAPVGQRQDWSRTDQLYQGSRIRYLGQPWETDESREAGYLAGIFDGEGCIATGRKTKRAGFRVSMAQLPGYVLQTTRRLLQEKGFSPSQPRPHKSGVFTIEIGRGYECLKFLGSIRPERLVGKAKQLYEGRALNRGQKWRVVDSVTDAGKQDVVAMQTTTGTLIADGMFSHNSGATSEKQAWEVFGPARMMLMKSPDILEDAGVEIVAQSMFRVEDQSKFHPIIGNPGDGASPSCSIIDEFHEHATSNLYDTMITGMGAREQPMCAIITTAGSNLAGPCYDKHLEARKVLEGLVENDELFAIIYSADEKDDWADPKTLIKANPNYGVSVDADFLLAQQRHAVLNSEQQNRFKTKHLNIWCSAKSAWMNSEWWRLCADPGLSIDEFKGEKCWFILDLASRNDVCAFAQLFSKELNGQTHYYAFGRYYLPEAAIEEPGPNQSAYRKWVAQGHLTATEGSEVDFDYVRTEIEKLKKDFHVAEILTDDWQSAQLSHQLMKSGGTVVSMPLTAKSLSPAMREMEAAIKSCRFHHNGDPIMAWMMSNVVAKEDANDNLFPRKEKQQYKIDVAVCIIMGVARVIVSRPKEYQMMFLG